MELFDWKRARLRSESNIAMGVILIILGIVAAPASAAAISLLQSQVGLIIVGLLGVGILVGIAQWRKQGAYSVYGLNMIGTVLVVYAFLGLLSADRAKQLLEMMGRENLLLIGLGALLALMGVGLRQTYLKKEKEQVAREAEQAENQTGGITQ